MKKHLNVPEQSVRDLLQFECDDEDTRILVTTGSGWSVSRNGDTISIKYLNEASAYFYLPDLIDYEWQWPIPVNPDIERDASTYMCLTGVWNNHKDGFDRLVAHVRQHNRSLRSRKAVFFHPIGLIATPSPAQQMNMPEIIEFSKIQNFPDIQILPEVKRKGLQGDTKQGKTLVKGMYGDLRIHAILKHLGKVADADPHVRAYLLKTLKL